MFIQLPSTTRKRKTYRTASVATETATAALSIDRFEAAERLGADGRGIEEWLRSNA